MPELITINISTITLISKITLQKWTYTTMRYEFYNKMLGATCKIVFILVIQTCNNCRLYIIYAYIRVDISILL